MSKCVVYVFRKISIHQLLGKNCSTESNSETSFSGEHFVHNVVLLSIFPADNVCGELFKNIHISIIQTCLLSSSFSMQYCIFFSSGKDVGVTIGRKKSVSSRKTAQVKLFYHSTRPEEKHQNVFFISGPMNEFP